jgi:hypothetical protein
MGTTINAEVSLLSKTYFTAPVYISVGIALSQKIANNEVYIEWVGIDDAGAVDETRVAAWRVAGTDSTTATTARYETRNGQAARRQSANITTASHSTGAAQMDIRVGIEEVIFLSRGVDTAGSKSVSGMANVVIPDPTKRYKLRIRFKNAGVAPATNTNVTLYYAQVTDYSEMRVKHDVEAMNSSGNSLPVAVTTSSTLGVNIAASATVGGSTLAKINAAAGTNALNLKTTAARCYGWSLTNTTAAFKYVRLYNLTTTPIVGTTVPSIVIAIPPNAVVQAAWDVPITFSSGFGYAITNASADLDATAVAALDVLGVLLWL